nr:hypothetical protein [uncultured Actinoplanes sp.]
MPALPLYDLSENPYLPRELDPLLREQDSDLVAMVDGWRNLGTICDYVDEQAKAGEPCLVLVSGASTTGRTSVANYLLRRWADARNHDPKSMLVLPLHVGHDFEDGGPILHWIGRLKPFITRQTRADGRKPLLQATTATELVTLASERPANPGPRLQSVLETVVVDLGDAWALAGVLEGVSTYAQVALTLQAFDAVDAMMVMIEDRTKDTTESLAGVDQLLSDGNARRVDLDLIGHEEIPELIRKRWQCHRPDGAPSPFDEAAIAQVFNQKRRTIAQVLRVFADMLTAKQDVLADKQIRWPHRDLEMGAGFMRTRLQYVESNFPAR